MSKARGLAGLQQRTLRLPSFAALSRWRYRTDKTMLVGAPVSLLNDSITIERGADIALSIGSLMSLVKLRANDIHPASNYCYGSQS